MSKKSQAVRKKSALYYVLNPDRTSRLYLDLVDLADVLQSEGFEDPSKRLRKAARTVLEAQAYVVLKARTSK